MTAFVLGGVLLSIAGVRAEEATMSIPEQLRQNGAFERIIIMPDAKLELADVTGRADLIVEATAGGARSFLSDTAGDIYTDCSLRVDSIVKNIRQPELRVGDTIVVRRESGTVVVEGRTAVSYENEFPAFEANTRYFLFLTKRAGATAYAVVGGAYGAFAAGDLVSSVRIPYDQPNGPAPAVSRSAFLGEIRALLRF